MNDRRSSTLHAIPACAVGTLWAIFLCGKIRAVMHGERLSPELPEWYKSAITLAMAAEGALCLLVLFGRVKAALWFGLFLLSCFSIALAMIPAAARSHCGCGMSALPPLLAQADPIIRNGAFAALHLFAMTMLYRTASVDPRKAPAQNLPSPPPGATSTLNRPIRSSRSSSSSFSATKRSNAAKSAATSGSVSSGLSECGGTRSGMASVHQTMECKRSASVQTCGP